MKKRKLKRGSSLEKLEEERLKKEIILKEEKFNKKELIKIALHYLDAEGNDDKVINERTAMDRLDTVILFLGKEEVKDVMNDANLNFIKKYVNFIDDNYIGRSSFNPIEVLFFSVLISLYKQLFFKQVRNESEIEEPEYEAEEWEEVVAEKIGSIQNTLSNSNRPINQNDRRIIELFDSLWDPRSLRLVSFNLGNILFQFSFLGDMYLSKAKQEVNNLVEMFEGLPDDNKLYVYNQFMKKRIEFMNRELKNYCISLAKSKTDESEYYRFYQKMNEIDKGDYNGGMGVYDPNKKPAQKKDD